MVIIIDGASISTSNLKTAIVEFNSDPIGKGFGPD